MPFRVEPHAEPILGYKLIERIGGGGFGEVWKAEAPGGLLKAIKIVHGDMETAGGESQKADQELKALRRVVTVRHPYILSLERFDIVDGRLLIVMELADRNLADRAKECRGQDLVGIPRDELLRYMEETAEALDLMNTEFQLQHLDVKPQNLFLVHNHIKVADFGLVKDLQDRMAATITGGVTPVYAAPETFDGWVSRYCDQYSLAIVYQELLTGQRPFTATNVHQLVMQHVQGKPNLESLSAQDRLCIGRALAKNPDDRFPSCMGLVDALRGRAVVPVSAPAQSAPPKSEWAEPAHESERDRSFDTTIAPHQREKLNAQRSLDAGTARSNESKRPPSTSPKSASNGSIAAEIKADGDLVPALVIGLGHLGLIALNQLSLQLQTRFGSNDALPQLRLLGIDTDSYSLWKSPGNTTESDSSLHRRDVLIARLNRAGHYLNPRNGRTSIDTWFDVNMLFRIRREPVTSGTRALGRLAFFGNYRSIRARLDAELNAILDSGGWTTAGERTGLQMRCNRPKIYIVTSLAGGTGSGMFIDLAYVVRSRLQELGRSNAEVVGIFLLPAAEAGSAGTLPLGNTYAALTELNHFSSLKQTGLRPFTARYDEHEKATTGSDSPFTRCVFLPAASGGNDLETPARMAGESLAEELTTPIGRLCESLRPKQDAEEPSYLSFGLYRSVWPRRAVLQGASLRLCGQIVQRWLAKDAGKPRQERIAALVKENWNKNEMGAETLITRFQDACTKVVGKETEAAIQTILDPLVSRADQLREADREALDEAMASIDNILGFPTDSTVMNRPGIIDDALKTQTEALTAEWQQKLTRFTIHLVDFPEHRFSGADESIRQSTRLIEQILTHHEPLSQELNRNASKANERLRFLVTNYAGIFKGRRPEILLKELHELLKSYPKWRFQSLVLRRVIYTYTGLRGFLSDQVRELGFYRLRLNELSSTLQTPFISDTKNLVTNGEVIFPSGCTSLTDAITQLAPQTTPEELAELDRRMQAVINEQFDSLQHICTTPSLSLKGVETAMLAQAESFIADRMPSESVADVYLDRHSDRADSLRCVRAALTSAVPTLGNTAAARTVVAVPEGGKDQFKSLVAEAAPEAAVTGMPLTDELVFYRETECGLPQILEYLGPSAEEAYHQLLDTEHFTPHTRIDVSEWFDLAADPTGQQLTIRTR